MEEQLVRRDALSEVCVREIYRKGAMLRFAFVYSGGSKLDEECFTMENGDECTRADYYRRNSGDIPNVRADRQRIGSVVNSSDPGLRGVVHALS